MTSQQRYVYCCFHTAALLRHVCHINAYNANMVFGRLVRITFITDIFWQHISTVNWKNEICSMSFVLEHYSRTYINDHNSLLAVQLLVCGVSSPR